MAKLVETVENAKTGHTWELTIKYDITIVVSSGLKCSNSQVITGQLTTWSLQQINAKQASRYYQFCEIVNRLHCILPGHVNG